MPQRNLEPEKWYQFIRSYPFKWRYFKGPYNSMAEAQIDMQKGRTVSPRCVMKGQEYFELRKKYDDARIGIPKD